MIAGVAGGADKAAYSESVRLLRAGGTAGVGKDAQGAQALILCWYSPFQRPPPINVVSRHYIHREIYIGSLNICG